MTCFPTRSWCPSTDRSSQHGRCLSRARSCAKHAAECCSWRRVWDDDMRSARSYLDDVATVHSDLDVSTIVIVDRPAVERDSTRRGGIAGANCRHDDARPRPSALGHARQRRRRGPARVPSTGDAGRSPLPRRWPNNFRRMVVCADGSTAAPAVEPTASEWATTLGLDVHVASVIHPLDALAPDAVLQAIVGRLETHGLHAHTCVLRDGYPAGAIADLAGSLDADLIAMSSHARTGTARARARKRHYGRRRHGTLPGPRQQDRLNAASTQVALRSPSCRSNRARLTILPPSSNSKTPAMCTLTSLPNMHTVSMRSVKTRLPTVPMFKS